jgi:secondary thiamine-phosphate synthase enzyme
MNAPFQKTFPVKTDSRKQFVDITDTVQAEVTQSGVRNGICLLFLPHTTAGLTLNENWDPCVPGDILLTLDRQTAPPHPEHRHSEGNSPAHIQSSLVGATLFLIIEERKILLGPWQGIFLTEFDGPRERHVVLKIIAG